MPILLIALGCALALWQLAVLSNFKGYRDRHAARTQRLQSRVMRSAAPEPATSPRVDPLRLFISALLFAGGIALAIAGIVMLW